MIANYLRPQTEIQQQFEETNNPLLDRLHAVVVGPAYIHADADSDSVVYSDYEAAAELPYQLSRDGEVVTLGSEVVDQDNVELLVKDLRIKLFEGVVVTAPYEEGSAIVATSVPFLDLEDPSVVEAFDAGRAFTPGDLWVFRATGVDYTVERSVVALLGEDVVASVADEVVYSGALGSGSGATDEVAVAYSNFTAPTVGFQSIGDAARLYARRNGVANLADNEGLRIVLELVCLTSGATPTFSATANGVTVAVSRSQTLNTRFTVLTDLLVNVGVANTSWSVGDRLRLNVDFEFNVDTEIFSGSIVTDAYTFESATRRLPSSVVFETLSIQDTGWPIVRVFDTTGLMTAFNLALSDGSSTTAVAYDGGEIEFALNFSGGAHSFHVGQRFSYAVTPPSRSTTVFDKVQLNAPLGAIGIDAVDLSVTAFVRFTGTLPALEPILGATNFTVGAESVSLGAALSMQVAGYPVGSGAVRYAEDGFGQVGLAWRAVIPAGLNEGLVAINSAVDILDNYFSYQKASELGYGLAKAFSGSQGKRVYALNTGGSTEADFQTAFEKLEAASNVYAIAVLTEDEDIMKLAAEHAQNMSAASIKRFRRCYVGTDSPGEYPILDLQDDDSAYTASIEQSGVGIFTLVTFSQEDLDLANFTITAGDKLLVTGTGQTYPIATVTGARTLTLETGPAFPIGATPCQILAADTPANTARFVWQRSGRLGSNIEQDRRISNIWTDNGRLDGELIPNRFGACEIAGIRTVLQPQQGLTRTEVSYIDSAPSMYTRFRPSVLDEMAANGVWIIAQNSAEGPCYVRHQITTAVSGSNSLYFEDSAGVNVDTVCFAMDDICDPKIGKRNATPRTVAEIKSELHDMLSNLTQDDYDSVIGPQLAGFFNTKGDRDTLDVAINSTFKDRIDVGVVLEIPLPLNNIKIVVLSRTIRDTGTVVTQLSTAVAV